jgi:glutathione S-transferase
LFTTSNNRARNACSGCWKSSACPTRSSATRAIRNSGLAPPELKQVHPLGKSPVITDGELVLAESGAILEYLAETYGAQAQGEAGQLLATPGSAEHRQCASGCTTPKAR